MERHTANALRLAQYLEGHRAIGGVNYPALQSSPFNARALRLLPAGAGALLSFEPARGKTAPETMIPRVRPGGVVPSCRPIPPPTHHPPPPPPPPPSAA